MSFPALSGNPLLPSQPGMNIDHTTSKPVSLAADFEEKKKFFLNLFTSRFLGLSHSNRLDISHAENMTCQIPQFSVETPTRAMDAKFFYAIEDGKIWFKPIAAAIDADWKPFGKHGVVDEIQTPLKTVTADGENVVVIDEKHCVHYAKNYGVNVTVSFDSSEWKIERNSSLVWTKRWFNMFGVAAIVNLFKDPVLKIPEYARKVVISHKDKNSFDTDFIGRQHSKFLVGTTSLIYLDETGTRYFLADPWDAHHFHNEITGPENGEFVAENVAYSGSTIFNIFRSRTKQGQEMHVMYVRSSVDLDSLGPHPLLPSTYDDKNSLAFVRVLPASDWVKQTPIPLEGEARLTKQISILQTGRYDKHRQLRVLGTNALGQTGYYHKYIQSEFWDFEITNEEIDEAEFLPAVLPIKHSLKGPKITFNYKGKWNQEGYDPQEIVLKNFSRQGLSERGLHTSIEVIMSDDKRVELPLYAHKGLWHWLGGDPEFKNPNWTLKIPDKVELPAQFKVLQNKRTCNLEIEETDEHIFIQPSFPSWLDFSIQLNKE